MPCYAARCMAITYISSMATCTRTWVGAAAALEVNCSSMVAQRLRLFGPGVSWDGYELEGLHLGKQTVLTTCAEYKRVMFMSSSCQESTHKQSKAE